MMQEKVKFYKVVLMLIYLSRNKLVYVSETWLI
jgi:hypothetical protein